MSNLDDLSRQYRACLCSMSKRDRLRVEWSLLSELQQRVVQAQMQFEKIGGQARMDHIEYIVSEMENENG